MAIKYTSLPVYEQKQKILDCLEKNQVVIVESPTGSGKTTQIPVILHEAGFSNHGIIAVTQPRRIAALSVSEFISKQLGTSYPGLVGYKMRFEDLYLLKLCRDFLIKQHYFFQNILSEPVLFCN
jgi:HrpA-like RNA helicase